MTKVRKTRHIGLTLPNNEDFQSIENEFLVNICNSIMDEEYGTYSNRFMNTHFVEMTIEECDDETISVIYEFEYFAYKL